MIAVFLKILNVGITAGWIVLGVLLLRSFFSKAPKWIQCLLWGIVALRLLVPVSLHSSISLIPSPEVIPQDIAVSQTPAINSGIPAVNSAINPLFVEQLAPEKNLLDTVLSAASVIWLAGVGVMLLFSLISWLRLHWKLRISLRLRDNIYLCDEVDSPFVFGTFRPGIYLPSDMDQERLAYVLAHEEAHIRRKDHWWKPLGYLLLTVYWFNPLLWVAYCLLCRDIEGACDEKVIAQMNPAEKKGYSEALVACSVHRRLVLACPVAFGEVGVKTRIKGVLRYKRPARWMLLIAGTACVLAACCFLTDPVPCVHAYHGDTTLSATCTHTGVQNNTCDLCGHSYAEKTQMLAHSYDQGVVATPSSCIQQGTLLRSCTDCDAQITESLELAAHTPGEPYAVKEPNCTEQGEQTATCTVCQAVFVTQVLPVNDVHNFQETVVKAATCTADGEGVKTCTRCAHTESVTYPKAAHSFTLRHEDPGTCMWDGLKWFECTVCKEEKVQSTAKGDHSYFTDYFGKQCCKYCLSFAPGSYSAHNSQGLPWYTSDPYPNTNPQWPVIRWDFANP